MQLSVRGGLRPYFPQQRIPVETICQRGILKKRLRTNFAIGENGGDGSEDNFEGTKPFRGPLLVFKQCALTGSLRDWHKVKENQRENGIDTHPWMPLLSQSPLLCCHQYPPLTVEEQGSA